MNELAIEGFLLLGAHHWKTAYYRYSKCLAMSLALNSCLLDWTFTTIEIFLIIYVLILWIQSHLTITQRDNIRWEACLGLWRMITAWNQPQTPWSKWLVWYCYLWLYLLGHHPQFKPRMPRFKVQNLLKCKSDFFHDDFLQIQTQDPQINSPIILLRIVVCIWRADLFISWPAPT